MDFDFDARAPGDFPRLDNVFRDDADKLHSDLVGISMDKASAASGDAAGATGEADFGLFSLQLEEDPRRSNRKKNEEEGSSKKQVQHPSEHEKVASPASPVKSRRKSLLPVHVLLHSSRSFLPSISPSQT